MRKIWPPEDKCIKLSENFARWKSRCEILSPLCENFAALLGVCKISQTPFSPAKWSLMLPDICHRLFWIFFFRYFCINFHFLLVFSHSCNSLARKYPRKGKLPSYINSLVNTKKGLSGSFNRSINIQIYHIQNQRTEHLLCFSYIFLFSRQFSFQPTKL